MTASDRLRSAAVLLRERAEAATPGPWGSWDGHVVRDVGEHTCGTGRDGHFGAHEPGCGLDEVARTSIADATFIATMSPPVALAIADWLDDSAHQAQLLGEDHAARFTRALTTADAVLGGAS